MIVIDYEVTINSSLVMGQPDGHVKLDMTLDPVDGRHRSFTEHYANAISSIVHMTTKKELATGLQYCLELARDNETLMQMCYESVFSADYFWE